MNKNQVAQLLLKLNCVKFSLHPPFQYSSGLIGPIYCDNRMVLSHVPEREQITQSFIDLIKEQNLMFDAVVGMATAGIPQAAWVAHELKKPLLYVRTQSKDHGKKNLVEGDCQKFKQVVLIEDLVNQGSSTLLALDALNSVNLKVTALVTIVDYGFEHVRQKFMVEKVPVFSLTDFDHLIKAANLNKMISDDELVSVNLWHQNPADWNGAKY